jgi:hypothetical protein
VRRVGRIVIGIVRIPTVRRHIDGWRYKHSPEEEAVIDDRAMREEPGMGESRMTNEPAVRGETHMSPTEALRVRGTSEHDAQHECKNEHLRRHCDDRPP